jgi:hypothetical protein
MLEHVDKTAAEDTPVALVHLLLCGRIWPSQ